LNAKIQKKQINKTLDEYMKRSHLTDGYLI